MSPREEKEGRRSCHICHMSLRGEKKDVEAAILTICFRINEKSGLVELLFYYDNCKLLKLVVNKIGVGINIK